LIFSLPACKRKKKEWNPSMGAAERPAEIWKQFSGANAFHHTQKLVELGPRLPATEGIEKARSYIIEQLSKSGWDTIRQTFTDTTPHGPVEFTNLIARYRGVGEKNQCVIIASHYDTKKFATFDFVGANDSGSSTGALVEMARVLAKDPNLAWKCELVFFDGEEAFVDFTETDGLYGSRHYARDLRTAKRAKQFKFGILWDMIGDKNLTITFPSDSPPHLSRSAFAGADALGTRKYFSFFPNPILDDHVPLNLSGIPTINFIDFDYPPWHTAEDTMDKLSPDSIETVAEVTLWMLRQAWPR